MLEGGWVQKDEAMKALHKVLRYNFSLGQTTASGQGEALLQCGTIGSLGLVLCHDPHFAFWPTANQQWDSPHLLGC